MKGYLLDTNLLIALTAGLPPHPASPPVSPAQGKQLFSSPLRERIGRDFFRRSLVTSGIHEKTDNCDNLALVLFAIVYIYNSS